MIGQSLIKSISQERFDIMLLESTHFNDFSIGESVLYDKSSRVVEHDGTMCIYTNQSGDQLVVHSSGRMYRVNK